jgi:GPH family glycoside/pentoside/hexuronide:cation symporter
MGAVFGIGSALPLLITFAGTKERPEFMSQERLPLKQSLKSAFRNKAFRYGLGIFLMTWVAVDILQATLLYFIKYIVQREPQSDLIMATIFVVGMLTLPIWEWVSRRFSKRYAYIAGIAFWAVVQLVLITLNSSSSLAYLLFLCVLAGVGVAAAHVLPWAIIPDAVEWDEWKTGERHEGMYYSLVTLIKKVASSIAIPLVLMVLEVTGYQPNSAVQPPGALLGIRITIGPIPAVMLGLGIFFAFRYPLTRQVYQRISQELSLRRLRGDS